MSEDINVGAISEALNNKADRDINNLTTGGYSKGSGLGMPSDRYIDLTFGATGSQYIPPANGWYMVTSNSIANNNYIALRVYNKLNVFLYGARVVRPYSNSFVELYIPISKNNILKLDYNSTASSVTEFRFIYAEGEQ